MRCLGSIGYTHVALFTRGNYLPVWFCHSCNLMNCENSQCITLIYLSLLSFTEWQDRIYFVCYSSRSKGRWTISSNQYLTLALLLYSSLCLLLSLYFPLFLFFAIVFHVKGPKKKSTSKSGFFVVDEMWQTICQFDDFDNFFNNFCNWEVFLTQKEKYPKITVLTKWKFKIKK